MSAVLCRAWVVLGLGASALATAGNDPLRSVVFEKPVPSLELETMIIEDRRDAWDRKTPIKPPLQRFREALEAPARPFGLAALDRRQALPSGFDRYTPHGAITIFRAGSEGPVF